MQSITKHVKNLRHCTRYDPWGRKSGALGHDNRVFNALADLGDVGPCGALKYEGSLHNLNGGNV